MNPTPAPAAPAAGELPEWLRGERARPTLPALAGAAGALVALVGMLLLLEEVDAEDLRAFGLALSGFTLLVGCVLAFVERRGALRAAGVGLAAGAVLPLALALVNDPTALDSRADVTLTGVVAVVAWLVLFVLGPARGHGLLLGLALLGAWFAAVSQTAPERALFWFNPLMATSGAEARTETLEVPPSPEVVVPVVPTAPTFTIPRPPQRTFREPSFPVPVVPVVPAPEPTRQPAPPPFPLSPEPGEEQERGQEESQQASLGGATFTGGGQPVGAPPRPPIAPAVVSMAFGFAYLVLAALLDQARLARLAGAFVAVGVPVLALGVVLVGPRHGATAVSVAAVAFGVVLVAVGAGGGRRFSGWAGAAVLAGGVAGLVGEAFEDPGSGDAVALLLVGAGLVGVGWFLSQPAAGAPEQPRPDRADQSDQAAHDRSS